MAKPYNFGDICEKLLSDPYVQFLQQWPCFSTDQKSPHQSYAGYPKKTFILSLLPFGQVVSEEKSLEKLLMMMTDDDDDGHKVMAIAQAHIASQVS